MRQILLCLVLLLQCALIATGAPIDEAKKLYQSGNYAEAAANLEILRKASPRDGNVNYYLGASLAALGRNDEAVAPLKTAESRGVADASRILTEIALDNYDIDAADEYLDNWTAKLKKNKKADLSQTDELRSRLVMMRNMLERVEKIEVVDSITVDSVDFFTHYRLSPEAGRLLSPEDAAVKARTLVYLPQNNREMIWAESDSTGNAVLMSASILDDGTIDNAAPLNGDFPDDGDADFPFLMPDGMTLYFAATGEASLGGYDIFMTRRSDDGFLQPQNLGMPYNSPYNDYMLAIDEATGAGWFASDRSQIPGKVTIYVFAPSQIRVNYDPDDETLAAKARLASIASTQTSAASALRGKIAGIEEGGRQKPRQAKDFELILGDGKVYTSLSDFQNRQAGLEMAKLLGEQQRLEAQQQRLDDLRERYRKGDRSVADDILDAEAAVDFMRESVTDLKNKVIRLETR
ncbi:MAG: tetratricopeptide repeat protein [Muribaculaceae bacterium]|nr:tetratricopeptide repeat protein [Muribaculaceae bacterium]